MNESQQIAAAAIETDQARQFLESKSDVANSKRVSPRMGVPYRARSGLWSIRARRKGESIHLAGFATSDQARRALVARLHDTQSEGDHLGKMSVAQAMQHHALRHLPRLRSARSEARGINTYLRAAGLRTLQVQDSPANSGFWTTAAVRLQESVSAASAVVGRVSGESARSSSLRAQLARTQMSAVSHWQVYELLNTLEAEGRARGTVLKERARLSRLFNYACSLQGWPSYTQNPMTNMRLQGPGRRRQRLMTAAERERLEAAFRSSGDQVAESVFTFLAETGVRARDFVEQACWSEVLWEYRLLRLRYPRLGAPFLPLSDRAKEALKAMQPASDPSQRIFGINFRTFKAAWKRACKVAGVEGLRIVSGKPAASFPPAPALLRIPASTSVMEQANGRHQAATSGQRGLAGAVSAASGQWGANRHVLPARGREHP